MFLKKDGRGYFGLYEKVNGKDVYRAYIGKHPEAYLRDLERTKDVRPEFLALTGNLTQAIAHYKRASTKHLQLQGEYRTIVIDPPWPMEKILRDCRPNQSDFDYPTMTIEEIKAYKLPIHPEGCHVYLWTTQKFLPIAFAVFEAWGIKYECLLTWAKNVGFTPFSWMYSTEHCLFGRYANLPLLKLGKRLDFQAKVREHSRKPQEFYDLIREVSPEPRIDIFSREKHKGFEQYGNETDKFEQSK